MHHTRQAWTDGERLACVSARGGENVKSAAAPEASVEWRYKNVYCQAGACARVLLSASSKRSQEALCFVLCGVTKGPSAAFTPGRFYLPPRLQAAALTQASRALCRACRVRPPLNALLQLGLIHSEYLGNAQYFSAGSRRRVRTRTRPRHTLTPT